MKRPAVALLALIVAGTALSIWLFPRAFPAVALERRVTRADVEQRADSFFRATRLPPESARTAVRFAADQPLLTYVDLAAGGKDTLDALVRGQDVAPFTWRVRSFAPGEVREATAHFAPDGRLVGFEQRLAEAERRPTVSVDSGRTLAWQVLTQWLGEPRERWRIVTESYETRPVSERVDRTYTFERSDRRIGVAPVRLNVVVHGDSPGKAIPEVVTPESFRRRYDEMRSANERLALLANAGMLVLVIAAIVALRRYGRDRAVRWRPAMAVGAVVGALVAAAGLNEVPSSWFMYDTATSESLFRITLIAGAILAGAGMMLMVAVTLAAAEVLTRHAFPHHADWWQLWRHRGTREVAGRVLGGYAAAAFGFAYVALFYVVTRHYLGWWVPSDLLDNPNQIATPAPWVTGIALALQAAVWEEALFRAVPMSLVALWSAGRPRRTLWMAGGVVLSALVFGFAHANYPSWPPYSRGAEIFLEACLWAVIFVRWGLLVTVVAHFAYNLVLFGLFAAAGDGAPYRLTAAVTLLALLAPALAVGWRWLRQGRLASLPDEARLGAWRPGTSADTAEEIVPPLTGVVPGRARLLAFALAGAALVVSILRPPRPVLGPAYTADRATAVRTADSSLRARGVDPDAWRRLAGTGSDTAATSWRRFLQQHDAARLASDLASTYAIPTWWAVRYVHDTSDAQARAEEWRVRVRPNGAPLDVRHVLPEEAPRPAVPPDETRRRAREALARASIDTAPLVETEFAQHARPARQDATVTYTDTSVHLPVGATARAWVFFAGDEVLAIRRGVELPESFLREERLRIQRSAIVVVPFVLALSALVIGGAVVVMRRRHVAPNRLSRRLAIALIAGLVLTQLVESVNALPRTLFGYDTALTWDAFLQRVGMQIAFGLAASLLLVALWLVVLGLARRLGVPLASAAASVDERRAQIVIAAAGIGGSVLLAQFAVAVAGPRPIPASPSTLLDTLVPWLSSAAAIPFSVAFGVPLLAIPGLVALGVSRRRSLRLAYAVLMALCAAGVYLSLMSDQPGWQPMHGVIVLAGIVVVVGAIMAWGRAGVVAWICAALLAEALQSLRSVLVAPTAVERAGGALGAAVAIALLAAAVHWGTRHGAEATPTTDPATTAPATTAPATAPPGELFAREGAGDDVQRG